MKQKTYDVIVVGGGAAGLMAAIHAASGGAHTAILDHHAHRLSPRRTVPAFHAGDRGPEYTECHRVRRRSPATYPL